MSASASGPIISIRSVTKRFPGVTALADVTLDVLHGELHRKLVQSGRKPAVRDAVAIPTHHVETGTVNRDRIVVLY